MVMFMQLLQIEDCSVINEEQAMEVFRNITRDHGEGDIFTAS
jgi:hypothetical protein